MSDRKRSPNWLMQEKMLLVDLVTEHFNIVENKRTDTASIKQKNAEWVKISEEYNSQTQFIHRTAENLKAQWESLKKATKKELSAKQRKIQTDGGSTKLKDDPLFRRIMSLISTAVVGLFYESDSDNTEKSLNVEDNTSKTLTSIKNPDSSMVNNSTPSFLGIDIPEQYDGTSEEDTADWESYSPKLLKTETYGIDTPLNKINTWNSKLTHASSTSETLEELHRKKVKATKIQMSYAAEEREEARKLFDIELKIKNELLKQEKVKTQLLLAQLAQLRRTKIRRISKKN
uniref:Regulatory protein zeste n=1 Tax=Heliothis virescens TaxID=7102 RepID=A0A2A4J6K5_HELVI